MPRLAGLSPAFVRALEGRERPRRRGKPQSSRRDIVGCAAPTHDPPKEGHGRAKVADRWIFRRASGDLGNEPKWLDELPRVVAELAAAWDLDLEEPIDTPHSLVVPAGELVLK